jgi:hypothetical protein
MDDLLPLILSAELPGDVGTKASVDPPMSSRSPLAARAGARAGDENQRETALPREKRH